MKGNNVIIISVALMLLVVASFYASDFSVTGTDEEIEYFEPVVSCEVPQDCYDVLIDAGYPKAQLDSEIASGDELVCNNGKCGGILK